jgi:hypothetical protein
MPDWTTETSRSYSFDAADNEASEGAANQVPVFRRVGRHRTVMGAEEGDTAQSAVSPLPTVRVTSTCERFQPTARAVSSLQPVVQGDVVASDVSAVRRRFVPPVHLSAGCVGWVAHAPVVAVVRAAVCPEDLVPDRDSIRVRIGSLISASLVRLRTCVATIARRDGPDRPLG